MTAAAAEGTAVLRFEVADIEALIGFVLQDQAVRTYNRKLLGSVRLDKRRLTHGLTPATIDWLVDQLHEEEYVEGYNIAPEGTVDQTLYIVKRGRVIVYTESVGEVAQLSPGDFFGELSLVPRRRQAAGADQPPAEDAAKAAARSTDGSGGEREGRRLRLHQGGSKYWRLL